MTSTSERSAVVLSRSWLAAEPLVVGLVVGVIAMAVTAVVAGYRDPVFPIAVVAGWLVAHAVWRTTVGPDRIVVLRPWGRRVIGWSDVTRAGFIRERGSEDGRYVLVAQLSNGRQLRLMSCARPPSVSDTTGDDRTDRRVAHVTAAFVHHGKPIDGLGAHSDAALTTLWARHGLTP